MAIAEVYLSSANAGNKQKAINDWIAMLKSADGA
jgi:hypothetical protein